MIDKNCPQVEPIVFDKIRDEEKNYLFGKEFGGYLIIENNNIIDIVIDVKKSSWGEVDFGIENILKIPEEQRNNVRGWFHKHNIDGLSHVDIQTIFQLTKFWGECYTLVLQRNGFLLLIKTVVGTDLIFRKETYIETHKREIKYREGPYGFIHIPQSIRNFQYRRI